MAGLSLLHTPDRTARAAAVVFFCAVAAMLIGPRRFEAKAYERVAPVADTSESTEPNAFRANGVYPSTSPESLPANLATHGSWLDSDAFQGRHTTRWYRAPRVVTLMVAGYPTLAGNRLEIATQNAAGAERVVRFAGANPCESWLPWVVTLPADATRVRIRAIDGSSEPGGWLAFSDPFTSEPQYSQQVGKLLQVVATTALALTLLFGPALLWLAHSGYNPYRLALSILIGPLLLAGLGLGCWLLGGHVAPAVTARIGIGTLLLAFGWRGWQQRHRLTLPDEVRTLIAATALLVGFAVAKADLSLGPPGELFGDKISRTLEVGGHSDSRISYQVVQLIATHRGPFSPTAMNYFSPWTFTSRGPWAGLLAAPIVLATGADVSSENPEELWDAFDRRGFVAYRIALIVLASLAAWSLFGLIAELTTPAWGYLAAVMALASPFFVHEMYFTWPKLFAAGVTLTAFLLAHRGRGFAAGLALGAAYLAHPLALLSAPVLGLWVLARGWRREGWLARLVAPLGFVAGLGFVFASWQAIGAMRPPTTDSQQVFFAYFKMADGNWHPSLLDWCRTRWENFANTFLPFHLLFFDPKHESLNSFYGPSDRWVQAGFLYWNTLPFALGLPGFVLAAFAIAKACRHHLVIASVTVLGPALLLIVYWGGACSGLMRHCGQVLFVSVIALAAWSLAHDFTRGRERLVRGFLHPLCFIWRGLEIAVMAFGTTLLHASRAPGAYWPNDVAALLAASGCLIALIVLLTKQASRVVPLLFASPARPVSDS